MSMPVAPGQVIAGKYRVTHMLGEGGMGVVVAADHLHLPQSVAIKLLRSQANETVVRRFEREAQIVVRLQSEHVCKVLDYGELPSREPYIVMERLAGQDLEQIAQARGALSVHEALHYILQACEALAEAHLSGVVHRDLKPSNLFLTHRPDGTPAVKLLDFGVSKATPLGGGEVAGSSLTQTGSMLGSPRYMSPEQLKSTRDVDLRSDIWALGTVLHQLLTGQAAFNADTVAELVVEILHGDPPSTRQLRSDVDPGIDAVIWRCLRKEPGERFANTAELALALAPFADPRSQLSVERIVRMHEASGWTRPAAPSGPVLSTSTAHGHPAAPGVGAASADGHVGAGLRPDAATHHAASTTLPSAEWPPASAHGPQAVAPSGSHGALVAVIVGLLGLLVLVGGGALLVWNGSASARSSTDDDGGDDERPARTEGSTDERASKAPPIVAKLQAQLTRAEQKRAAGDDAGARAEARGVILAAEDSGIRAGQPGCEVPARAQLLLGQIMAAEKKKLLVPASSLQDYDEPVSAAQTVTGLSLAELGNTARWQHADSAQCATVAGAELVEETAVFFSKLTAPPPSPEAKVSAEEAIAAYRAYAKSQLSIAESQYTVARGMAAHGATECKARAQQGLDRVRAAAAALGP